MDRETDNILKQLSIVFAVVLLAYAAFFWGDRYLRAHKGPWEVRFVATNSAPRIAISQPRLGISNVVIVFTGESLTNVQSGTVLFDRPQKAIPFGKTKFEDLTYLPGSVAFDFFGHEIELLPRTLYINKTERAWNSTEIRLKPSEKLPPEKFYDPRKKKRRF
jgi:hypothetical protein